MAKEFFIKTDVSFGQDSISELNNVLKGFQAKNVLVVYDKGVAAVGIADKVLAAIDENSFCITTFDEVIPNPTNEVVNAGYQLAKDHDVDTLIAVGGGSSIDTAKAINVLLANGGDIMDYEGIGNVPKPVFPLVAIPTTAGTSSEITNVAALIDTKSVRKYVVIDNKIVPDKVIADPEFTRTVPPFVTAATGLDAITHAVESYVSIESNFLTKYNSLRALQIFHENLPKAYANGDDMDAREKMMLGCIVVGFGFSNANLGLVHAIAHTLSAHFGLAHGDANASVLPFVTAFNAEKCPQEMIEMARALDLPLTGDEDKDKFALSDELLRMTKEMGIKPLREQGRTRAITEDDFDLIASDALKEGPLHFNPRQDVTKEVIIDILKQAY
ncbi:MAG: iron-containing alcohol dehydrogenase [Lachnospiraceae bacterium]|nr:iron-containing alcohol dehydrogenase [Lachnospiraceae bacterium]